MLVRAFFLVVALAAAAPFAAAQEQAFTNRSTELRDKGANDGKTIATLPENTAVKVTQRAGGWTKVEGGGQSGWVRAFHLRFPAAVETSSSSGGLLGGLTGGLFGGKTTKATTATVGIRGLSAEDFKNANPDAAALARMESFRVDKAGAQAFAREARLSTVSVNYLMEEAVQSSGRRR
jgi:uncharacterized protein YgiM (DUF1202 family)